MAKGKTGNVVNLATKKKGGRSTTAKPKATKPVVKVEVVEEVKEPTPDELAKERVEDLLKDVDLNPLKPKDDDLLEFEEDDGQPKSIEWLEEQVGKLGEENERLRVEAGEAKENYSKLYARYETLSAGGGDTGGIVEDHLVPDSLVKNGAMALFEEFQTEYLRHPAQTRQHTKISLVALMKKMLEALPFLEERRRV